MGNIELSKKEEKGGESTLKDKSHVSNKFEQIVESNPNPSGNATGFADGSFNKIPRAFLD